MKPELKIMDEGFECNNCTVYFKLQYIRENCDLWVESSILCHNNFAPRMFQFTIYRLNNNEENRFKKGVVCIEYNRLLTFSHCFF